MSCSQKDCGGEQGAAAGVPISICGLKEHQTHKWVAAAIKRSIRYGLNWNYRKKKKKTNKQNCQNLVRFHFCLQILNMREKGWGSTKIL